MRDSSDSRLQANTVHMTFTRLRHLSKHKWFTIALHIVYGNAGRFNVLVFSEFPPCSPWSCDLAIRWQNAMSYLPRRNSLDYSLITSPRYQVFCRKPCTLQYKPDSQQGRQPQDCHWKTSPWKRRWHKLGKLRFRPPSWKYLVPVLLRLWRQS